MEQKNLLKKVFPVQTHVINRSEKIIAKKPTDYEGYKKEIEHYYVDMTNYPFYKAQMAYNKHVVDVGEMTGVYPYDPADTSFTYEDLKQLESVILKYDQDSDTYKKVNRIVQNRSLEEQVQMNQLDNIVEYWNIDKLSPRQRAEVLNILDGAIEKFDISNNIYTKSDTIKTL